ncbi:hypothetical protein N431DRAFT_420550 [Stipitochalara longipes BDJ]|nr:hypothetical protein N431DRAFT_420550 [Stipitochalara longipes BDJ]
MEAQQASITRKRIVASCSNCYRRKQKCNRARPCNNCIVRKVGHECFYDTLPRSYPPHENHDLQGAADTSSSGSISAAVRDQFGYSLTEESNAFVEAGEVFQDSNGGGIYKSFPDSVSTTWQKYWQVVSELLCIPVFDELIASYLSEVHWIYGIIEPRYFNDTLREWRKFTSSTSGSRSVDTISAELRCFPAMLFQLLATSLLFLPPGTKIERSLDSSPLELSQKYSDAGVEVIHLLGCQGTTLVGVQHDLLRAAWLKNRGHGAEAWHALSSSIRKAQDLNLHRRGKALSDPSKIDFWYDDWKKRLWVTLYVWDGYISILLGRPRLINTGDCNVEPPLDCDIPENLESINLQMIRAQVSRKDRLPSSVCVHLFMYSLAQKIHEIRALGADNRSLKDYTVVQRLHCQIVSLLEDLPSTVHSPNPDVSWDLQIPVLPRQRERIYTSAQSILMALHRPHVAKHTESRKRAQEAALNVLESQQRLFEVINRNHYAYFGHAFYSIDAAIVLSTVISVYPCTDIGMLYQIVHAIQQAMGRLSLIETQNELAPFGIDIMRSCYRIVKGKYDENRHANLKVMSGWLSNTNHQDIASGGLDASHQNFDFSQAGDDFTGAFPVFNATTENQANFAEINQIGRDGFNLEFPDFGVGSTDQADFAQMNTIGRNEFDTSYWTDYRQLVFNDATTVLESGMYHSSQFG